MRDPEMLSLPPCLDEEGQRTWASIAPYLRECGLLTPANRADIEWLVRVHCRIVVLSGRIAARTQDVGQDPDQLEHAALSAQHVRLLHRYALTPAGRSEMERRGWPGTPNLLPEDMLEDEREP